MHSYSILVFAGAASVQLNHVAAKGQPRRRRLDGATVVDLAQDWVVDTNAEAEARLDAAVAGDILSYALVQGGRIVAEHYRDGRDASSTAALWSVTKSWMALLIGTLEKDGLLTRRSTLGELFGAADWTQVSDAAAKKRVTVEDILQMESGFEEDGSLFYEQHDLVGVLNFGTFDASETGAFHYQNNHLLSYVVLEVTGLTPLEYASEKVFPALGVDPSELSWWANNEGVSYGAFGLFMCARQMLKLGQLMLQGGDDLVTPAWVSDTFTDSTSGDPGWAGYGYLWWLPRWETSYLAIGYNGQFVAIYPDHDAMFVIQSDDTTSDASSWDLLGEVPSVIAGLPPAPTPAPSSQSPRPTPAPTQLRGGSSGSSSGGSDEVLDGASIGLLVGVVFLAAAVAGGAFYYRLSKRATWLAPVVELARREAAAFCTQCGAARACGADFCTSCGTPFVDERLPP